MFVKEGGMNRSLRSVSFTIVVAISVLVGSSLAATRIVEAGHQIVGGDCWRAGTPTVCRFTWSGPNTLLYVRLIDQFSQSSEHQWYTAATNAGTNWTNANGPQIFAWTAHSNDTWDYLKFCTDNISPCFAGVYGYTQICNTNNYCSNSPVAMDIYYANVWLDATQLDPLNDTSKWTHIFAHEYGHTLGLDHHNVTGVLMNGSTSDYSTQGPTPTDIGPTPPCSGASGQSGIRCIYDYQN
jgi:hypothetical protein